MKIKVVTICGSMRFASEMQKIATVLETKNGWCVIQCCYGIDKNALTKQEIDNIVNAHWKKIDVSDAIYVVNIGGYIGNSTQNEIEYAKQHGKEIIYHENKFSFKLYFRDKSTKILKGKASSPENLKYDFDGLISWEEYDRISNMDLTAKEVLEHAERIYNKKYNNQIVRIEVLNIVTNEIIDFVEKK